jgi:hypothetical protein
MAGINPGDVRFVSYSSSNAYVYYYKSASSTFVKSIDTALNFENKNFNLVYTTGTNNAIFSYWKDKFAIWSIDDTGNAVPVQLPSGATTLVP